MAPVKFDDIPKVANEVLNDDYQISGYVFKAKQKTSWGGAVLSTQVDLFQEKEKCVTPAKLAWRLPAPFGCPAFCIDKLEIEKSGKFKLEASSDKVYPGVKVDCKSDLVDVSKIAVGCTATSVKNAQFKFECKAAAPQDFTAEATYTIGIATCGLKFTPKLFSSAQPDLGLRLFSGPFFCSLLAKEKFGNLSATAHYKASPDLRCAAACNYTKRGTGVIIGCTYKGLYKVKVTQDQTISCSAKHAVAKGFTLLGGAQYSLQKGSFSYGLQLSIE